MTRKLRNAQARAVLSEESFRLLVESVKDYAIFMLDPDGAVRTWNSGILLLKGYQEHEILGKSFAVFYTEEDRARGLPQQLLTKAADQGRVEHEGWRVRKDGTRFWADVVITAIRDGSGALVGYAKVTRDLTERRALEDALRRSEERLRRIVEGVKDYAIFMLDPGGHVQTWNEGAKHIKQYTATEIIGKHFSVFYTPEDLAAGKTDRELAEAIASGRAEDEGWRLRRDGTKFWASSVLTALHDAGGKLVGFAKVTRDLTDRKKAEEERLRLTQAREAIRLRDEFLTLASHELKTPLTALQLQLQTLAHKLAQDPDVAGKITRAKKSGDRLAALIESLFDVSRIATGQLELHPEPLDLSVVALQVVETFQTAAAVAGVRLCVDTPGAVEGSWDRVRIEQVLSNLVANAIKYGGGSPVDVSVSREGSEAVLVVRDRGPGIPAADLERIFERFERASSARHHGGLGLGLFVARQIAEAHGGSVSASNAEGGGASFTLRLPLQRKPQSRDTSYREAG